MIGDTVLYVLTDQDAQRINQTGGRTPDVGNQVRPGDIFPAVIVRQFEETDAVNLQVLLDGSDTLWATSRSEGDGPGCWTQRDHR